MSDEMREAFKQRYGIDADRIPPLFQTYAQGFTDAQGAGGEAGAGMTDEAAEKVRISILASKAYFMLDGAETLALGCDQALALLPAKRETQP